MRSQISHSIRSQDLKKLVNNTTFRVIAFTLLVAMCFSILPFTVTKVSAAGTISGTVYIDYNMNGAMDTSGVAPNYSVDKGFGSGVIITVYDSSGTQQGSATTNASGVYNLNATGTGPYRIEFTDLPSNYFPSAVGTNNDSTVQFAPDGSSSNIDLGIVSQKEYCQNNPDFLVNCYVYGGSSTATDVLVNFPYSAGAAMTETTKPPYENPTAHSILLTQAQIGPTWGLGYARKTNRAYAAAFFKKHTVFGPGGPGAIYQINPSTNTVTNTFTVPGATTNSHGTTNVCAGSPSVVECDNGNTGWDAVGKTSLGGLALSEDETNLYVMNLENRTLYEMNALTGVVSRLQSMPGVPNVAGSVNNISGAGNLPPGAASATDVRPFAVEYYEGKIYIGLTSTAETTSGTLSNLQAHVYELDPTTFGLTLRVSAVLNYNRGLLLESLPLSVTLPAEWNAWRTTFANVGFAGSETGYPQPMFTGIAFDDSGNLVMGIRDRAGDQMGVSAPSNPFVTTLYSGDTAGDVLKACGNQTIGWTLENNARCDGEGNGTQGNGQGVGGGEFYYGDRYSDGSFSHDEISLGGLSQVPGRPEIVSTVFDPVNLPSGAFSAGARWWVNNQGNSTRAYNLFTTSALNTTFGKAGGLGDLVAMCDLAPLQIGNRIWDDANGNGVQDPGENGISGVAVELWQDTNGDGTVDTQVGTVNTDANGNYVFGGINNENLLSNPVCSTTQTINVSVGSSSDDADQIGTGTSLTRNFLPLGLAGTVVADGVRFGGVNIPQGATITNAYIQFTANDNLASSSGAVTTVIQGEDADNPVTYTNATTNNISARPDTTASVNWSIPNWSTPNQSGANQRTPGLTTIVQEIVNRGGWASGNAMAFTFAGGAGRRDAESFDGNSANAPQLVIEYASTCEVEPNTAYEVRIPSSNFSGALNGFQPVTPNNDATANGDSRDSDGIVLTGMEVYAPVMTGENGNNNHSYDFGFSSGATTYSVGNRIWFDTNDNGIIDGSEVGKSGVSVSLFPDTNSDGVPDITTPVFTQITDANGYYRFDGLSSLTWLIRIDPSNFASGGMLEDYRNTTGINTGDVESFGAGSNAENGANPAVANSVLTDGILSNTISLGPGEPTSEADVPSSGGYPGQGTFDANSNVTIDMGFYKLSLSGTVWADNGAGTPSDNNDGELDTLETRLSGYTVQLYDVTGTTEILVGADGILGTADDGPGGMLTDGSGEYNFQGLPAGQYVVAVTANNAVSSTPTELNPDDNGDNNDNGVPGAGVLAGKIISLAVTLTPGDTGAMGNNAVSNADGSTLNPTVDFGLVLAPTAVQMDKMDAYFEGGKVAIEWSTGDEAKNLGFNVYRQAKGRRELITSAPVAGSGLKTTASLKVKGNSYKWIDSRNEIGSVYYIEDIDIDGTRTMHGPITPNAKFSFDSTQQVSSKLISDLARIQQPSKQKEFVSKADSDSDTRSKSVFDSDRQREIVAMSGVKLFVKERGWYKVSASDLQQAGFDANSDSSKWRLYANGVEVPIIVGVNRSTNERIVEFYGHGVDTNITDEQVYYLIKDDQSGLRLSDKKGGSVKGEADALSFETTVMRKDRSLYFSALLNGEKENWFGSIISSGAETYQDLILKNPVVTDGTQARLRVILQGLTVNNHLVNVSLNGTQIGTVDYADRENEEFEFNVPMSSINNGVNRVGLRSVGSGDISLVDSVSITYARSYVAVGNELRVKVPANQTAKINGFEDNDLRVFEINGEKAVREIGVEVIKINGTAGFGLSAASYERELLVIDSQSYSRSVERVEANDPSSISSTDNEADFIIISAKSLSSQAEILAVRRQAQGLNTLVVSVEDIYDEYSFGMRSATAIKDFLTDANSVWNGKPSYVLLFGDSSYDHRNYLNQTDRDLIPTKLIDTEFMETSSDGWLADFDGDGIEDISLGRLPVGNASEANQMLVKLARYDAQEARQKRENLLVADNYFESYSDQLESRLPNDAGANRINRSQMSDSRMRSEILAELSKDPMVVTYTGHGATGVWVSSNVFRNTDAASLSNSKLSFYMVMSCLNGFNHNAGSDSMAESLLKAENGAIAVWASSGSTYASGQIQMSLKATEEAFNSNARIGDLIRNAKQTTSDQDARKTWQLIGDPTIVIK